jgi:ribosome-associated protein
MDIRKLQRVIVDGLEDVKAQNIVVFNTEHLSPLFERVIVASGASNRQTKALAASIRDAVRAAGMDVLRTEGEENGEWIIVDCGAAVAHVMQPSIRDYYRLEEIWGGKPVKIKLSESTGGLVKASEPDDEDEDDEPARKPRSKSPRAARLEEDSPARKAALKTSGAKSAGAKKPAQEKRPAIGKDAATQADKAIRAAKAAKAAPAKKLTARQAAATKPAGSQRGVAKPAPKTAAGKLSAAAKTRAGSTAARTGKAPAKTASVKKVVVPANSSRNAATAGKKTADKKAATKAAGAKKAAARRG